MLLVIQLMAVDITVGLDSWALCRVGQFIGDESCRPSERYFQKAAWSRRQ